MKDRKWGFPRGCPALILVFALALSSAFLAYGQSTVVARAAGVTGQAILMPHGLAPLALTAGYILTPGDRIDTRGGGRVVIDLSDGSMVVVAPESIVVLKDYRAAASLRELFGITLGMVRVKINHFAGKPNPYRMNSPTASIAVRGTEFSIEVDAEGATQVVVYEGAVEVASLADPDRRVLIEAGRGVLVQGGQDFHLIGAIPPQPGNRDAGDRNGPPERAKPVQLANARGPDGPPQPGAGSPPPPPQGPIPQAVAGTSPHAEHDRDDTAARLREHLRPLSGGPGRHRAGAVPVSLQRFRRSASGQPGESRLRHRISQRRGPAASSCRPSAARAPFRNTSPRSAQAAACPATTASHRSSPTSLLQAPSPSAAALRFHASATRHSLRRRITSPAPSITIRSLRPRPAAVRPAPFIPRPWWRHAASAPTVSAWNWLP